MTCTEVYPELGRWLDKSAKFRQEEKELEDKVAQVGRLGLNEFYLLYYLETCPTHHMRVQEAQELIQMSQSAMSRLIQRLENLEQRLVFRQTCNIDKRGVYVHLTPAGADMYQKIAEAIRPILEKE